MTDRLISAVPVPFTTDGSLDLPTLEATYASLEPHVDSVLVAGTTGEFPALDDDERLAAFEAAVSVFGAPRVIAHVGHASSHQLLRLADRTRALGVDRLAALSPYYLPSDDAGVLAFYAALSEAHGDAEIYPYLFPERTGADVSPEVLGEVMRLPGMSGVKLSGTAAARLTEYLAVTQSGQAVWSGDDATFGAVLQAGGHGVVSGCSSVFPATFAALGTALAAGDEAEIARRQESVVEVVGLVGPSITRLKVGLAARDGAPWASRMSLPGVDADLRDRILQAVAVHG